MPHAAGATAVGRRRGDGAFFRAPGFGAQLFGRFGPGLPRGRRHASVWPEYAAHLQGQTATSAPEVIAEIERTVRRASPFPAPTRLGKVIYTETWLWDKSGQFQLDTLTEGQE